MASSIAQNLAAGVFAVVPSYNHSPFVEQCLRSIFAQTHSPAKLLVIDDGSTDDSVAVIERTLKDCPFECELIARANRGLSATLNEALGHSAAEFFAYLGSDDVWLPQMLAGQTALLALRPDAALAFSHAFVIDENGGIFDRTDKWTAFADGDLLPVLLGGEVFSSPGVVYRRSFLGVKPWNENSILEDYELYLKLAAKHPFVRNENILCGWRQHGRNVSGDHAKMVEEWIAAQKRVAGSLPYSREELDAIQSKLRYEAARGLIRTGNRRDALRAIGKHRRDAGSAKRLAADVLRVAIPRPLFSANRRRKSNTAIRRYGNIATYL